MMREELSWLSGVYGHEPLEHAEVLARESIGLELCGTIARLVVECVLQVQLLLMTVRLVRDTVQVRV